MMTSEIMKRRLEAKIPDGHSVSFRESVNDELTEVIVLNPEGEEVAAMTLGEIGRLRFRGKGWASKLAARVPEFVKPEPEPELEEKPEPKRRRRSKKKAGEDKE